MDAGALVETVGKLRAGGHAELPEHLAQVVFHGARADEHLGGDLPVRFSSADQGGDLCLLGCQLLRRSELALLGVLTGGPQLCVGPRGEAAEAHGVEHLEGCAQLISCLPPLALAA